jgi:hypothetical protein
LDTKVTADAYGVWDTKENKWWFRRNKRAWGSKSAAANAWNAENGRYSMYYRGKREPKFSEQTRFVTKGIRYVAID